MRYIKQIKVLVALDKGIGYSYLLIYAKDILNIKTQCVYEKRRRRVL